LVRNTPTTDLNNKSKLSVAADNVVVGRGGGGDDDKDYDDDDDANILRSIKMRSHIRRY
jgi:hypothetical protein